MSRVKDMLGQRFGRLVVFERAENKRHSATWRCRCDCGGEKVVWGFSLRDGSTSSCGCMAKESRLDSAKRGHITRGLRGGLTKEIGRYKSNARKSGRSWELTYDQAHELMTKPCHYCGTPPTMATSTSYLNKVEARNGIDRIDNSVGYTPKNSVTCCIICNHAKHTLPLSDFLSWVQRIAQHQGFTTYNPPPIQEDQSMKWTVM